MNEQSGLQIVNVVSLRPQDQPVPGTSKTPASNSGHREKPLLNLITNLLNYIDNETNTSMTNAQLIDILNDEFNIDIATSHNLEIEIYISVLKKFLKIWPRWDVLEKFVQTAKQNPQINLEEKLVEEYLSLKEYLNENLAYSKLGATQAAKKAASIAGKTKKIPSLYVTSSQDQLYNLFFQAPDSRNTILNARPLPKTTIQVNNISFNEVLHWPNTMITVNLLGILTYQYENTRELKHTLINHKLGKTTEPPVIPKDMLTKPRKTKDSNHYDLKAFLNDEIKNSVRETEKNKILSHIKDGLPNLPKLTPSCVYKAYLNPYPYVRYFKNPNDLNRSNSLYDLELEEYFSPVVTFSIDTVQGTDNDNWLKVSCLTCSIVFSITERVDMMTHFRHKHSDEADYVCTNCKMTFQFQCLAEARWRHDCV